MRTHKCEQICLYRRLMLNTVINFIDEDIFLPHTYSRRMCCLRIVPNYRLDYYKSETGFTSFVFMRGKAFNIYLHIKAIV